jgi:hypothetical protein
MNNFEKTLELTNKAKACELIYYKVEKAKEDNDRDFFQYFHKLLYRVFGFDNK